MYANHLREKFLLYRKFFYLSSQVKFDLNRKGKICLFFWTMVSFSFSFYSLCTPKQLIICKFYRYIIYIGPYGVYVCDFFTWNLKNCWWSVLAIMRIYLTKVSGNQFFREKFKGSVDTVDTVEGVCNGFLPYTWFLGFLEFSGYHQWQQESQ